MKHLKIIAMLIIAFSFTGCGLFRLHVLSNLPELVFDKNIDYSSPLLNQRIIILNSDIGPHSATKVISKLFYLNSKDKTKPIDIYLNTDGGDIDAAFMIIETIKIIEAPVNVWAFVDVRSAGIIILQAATGNRIGTENSIFLIHGVSYSGYNPQYLELMKKYYIVQLLKRSNLPKEWFPLKPDVIHIITPSEALKYGLIDFIVPDKRINLNIRRRSTTNNRGIRDD